MPTNERDLPSVRREISLHDVVYKSARLAAYGGNLEESGTGAQVANEENGRTVWRESWGEIGPLVSATSLPSATCLSQILDCPSRSELKAMVRPPGAAAGEKSRPE